LDDSKVWSECVGSALHLSECGEDDGQSRRLLPVESSISKLREDSIVNECEIRKEQSNVGDACRVFCLNERAVVLPVLSRIDDVSELLVHVSVLLWKCSPCCESGHTRVAQSTHDLEQSLVVLVLQAILCDEDEALQRRNALFGIGGGDDLSGDPRAHAVQVGDDAIEVRRGLGSARLVSLQPEVHLVRLNALE